MRITVYFNDGRVMDDDELHDDVHVPTGGSIAIHLTDGLVLNMGQSAWDKCIVCRHPMTPEQIIRELL
jgi:hypothetical protein